jgi:hypothetical protein
VQTAAWKGHDDIFELLIDQGADANAEDGVTGVTWTSVGQVDGELDRWTGGLRIPVKVLSRVQWHSFYLRYSGGQRSREKPYDSRNTMECQVSITNSGLDSKSREGVSHKRACCEVGRIEANTEKRELASSWYSDRVATRSA